MTYIRIDLLSVARKRRPCVPSSLLFPSPFIFASIKQHLLFLNIGCPQALSALIEWVGMPDIKSK